jgi:hypothetical protein
MKAITTALVAAAALAAFAPGAAAAQRKDCQELKGEIEAKIRQNGVDRFSLAVVDASAPPDGKVVGICDGGSKQIVYKRGG